MFPKPPIVNKTTSIIYAVEVGLTEQVGADVPGAMVVEGAVPRMVSALISTGIIPPVCRLKATCPKTLKRPPIAPEWLVKLMKVWSSLVNISSRRVFTLASRCEFDSRKSDTHKGSSSAKPCSNLK